MQYVKVSGGYIAIDDDSEIRRECIILSRNRREIHTQNEFAEAIREARTEMTAEGYDLIAATDYTPLVSSNVIIKRIFSFAKKDTWRFVEEKSCEENR